MKLAQEGQQNAIHYRTARSDSEKTLSLIEAAGASGVLVQGDEADRVTAENLVREHGEPWPVQWIDARWTNSASSSGSSLMNPEFPFRFRFP